MDNVQNCDSYIIYLFIYLFEVFFNMVLSFTPLPFTGLFHFNFLPKPLH
jgi:hypothetical protein